MTYVRHRYGGLYNSQLPHEERQWSASASTAVAPRFAIHCGAHCGSRQRTASMLDASKREALPPSCVAASVSTVDAVSEAEPAMESSTSFGPLPPWIPRAAVAAEASVPGRMEPPAEASAVNAAADVAGWDCNQSRPSKIPSPFVAQLPWMNHFLPCSALPSSPSSCTNLSGLMA